MTINKTYYYVVVVVFTFIHFRIIIFGDMKVSFIVIVEKSRVIPKHNNFPNIKHPNYNIYES